MSVVVYDTRTPIGVAQLIDTIWSTEGAARRKVKEINTNTAQYLDMVAWHEVYTLSDSGLLVPPPKDYARGSANGGGVILNDDIVRESRDRYRAGQVSITKLAAEYGVSRKAMSNALMGITWRHVI